MTEGGREVAMGRREVVVVGMRGGASGRTGEDEVGLGVEDELDVVRGAVVLASAEEDWEELAKLVDDDRDRVTLTSIAMIGEVVVATCDVEEILEVLAVARLEDERPDEVEIAIGTIEEDEVEPGASVVNVSTGLEVLVEDMLELPIEEAADVVVATGTEMTVVVSTVSPGPATSDAETKRWLFEV